MWTRSTSCKCRESKFENRNSKLEIRVPAPPPTAVRCAVSGCGRKLAGGGSLKRFSTRQGIVQAGRRRGTGGGRLEPARERDRRGKRGRGQSGHNVPVGPHPSCLVQIERPKPRFLHKPRSRAGTSIPPYLCPCPIPTSRPFRSEFRFSNFEFRIRYRTANGVGMKVRRKINAASRASTFLPLSSGSEGIITSG